MTTKYHVELSDERGAVMDGIETDNEVDAMDYLCGIAATVILEGTFDGGTLRWYSVEDS